MTRRHSRQTYDATQCLVPELTMLGWDDIRDAQTLGLHAHVHDRAYEICCIARGSVDWWIEDRVYEVRAGDLFITRPKELHGGVDAVLHPCELYWTQVILPRRGALPGLSLADSRRLVSDFDGLHHRCFPGSEATRLQFTRLLDEHRQRPAHAAAAARAALYQLLIGVARDHAHYARTQRDQQRTLSIEMRRARDWIDAHLGESFGIEEAAAVAGLSVTQFHDRFRREVGLPPGEYRSRRRIARAKHLLRHGAMPITRIAMELGYSTSQYFATAFTRLVGLSPRDYRRAASRPRA